jgi:UDP:flavonoid glycosyltransferase YjiC (YdhE family)
VIFYDFRFTSKISGVRASCPTVGIVHGNAILISQAPKIFAQRIIAPGNANEGLKNKFRMTIIRKIFPFAFQIIMRRFASRLNPFLKELSIYPIKSPFDLLFGDHTIVADIPQLIPNGLSGNFHVIGPLLWDGWSRPEPWLDDLDTDPLIYITMGSTVESFSTITKILNALKEQPYNIVVSTGTLKPDFSSDLPKKIRVFSYVSGQTVLKRSALVIHHGGHETLMQALAAGTPSLAVPINPDQIMIAKQIEELSFGRYLRNEDAFPMDTNPLGLFSAEEIQIAVKSVINNRKIKMTCEEVGHQFCRSNNLSPLEDFLQMKSFTNYEKGG